MFRKYFSLPVAAGLLMISAIVANAQTGELRGHVKLKQADGTSVPLVGAVIDVFRRDLTGKYETKTDKRGSFVFAGLPYVGTYLLGISGPGAQPNFQDNVKVGRDIDYEIVLEAGDGRRLTLAEINTVIKGGSSGAKTNTPTAPSGESAADKAKRAEVEAKNKELIEKNKHTDETNKILTDKFKAGNAALSAGETASRAGNYAEADKLLTDSIAQYDEGINADPTHPGAPTLMTNKSQALMDRGIARYNGAVKSPEYATAVKSGGGAVTALLEPAKKDWKDAAETISKAVEMVKATPAPTDPADLANYNRNKYFAVLIRAEAMNKLVTKVDPTQADAGVAAYEEYIAVESDAVKKAKAERDLAKMLFDSNAYDKAKLAYDKILASSPDDPEALQNQGLTLYNLGFIKESEGKKDEAKASYQEAANYLGRFVEKSPDGQLKSEAQDILKNLKEQQNVQAEKVATPTRRRKP
ncbi:MAG TPA: carboxypeptidase regulatory-like domain-containing protein [Pyrinomonadaceae bacterium]|jgi:tetratricopeptide (TPR) repeat protein|nr:carboxypeptidase regulatory-like domain-containing protein [Pyrinomonadaceae bacterium]